MKVLYRAMRATGCDGYPASDRPAPLWGELAAARQGRKVAEEMEDLGVPNVLIVRTHWHEDGSFCAHIGDKAYRITRRQITERRSKSKHKTERPGG